MAISLAQWSLHRAIGSAAMDSIDILEIARESFDLGAVELVSNPRRPADQTAHRTLEETC